MVLDGWNRWLCVQDLGIALKSTPLPDGTDPVAFVKSRNLHRRHMTASQRAAAVVACSEWRPVGRQEINVAPGATLTNSQMAEEASVSTRTIRQAKVVLDRAAPEVQQAVRAGTVSVKAAAEIAQLPAAQQVQALTALH